MKCLKLYCRNEAASFATGFFLDDCDSCHINEQFQQAAIEDSKIHFPSEY